MISKSSLLAITMAGALFMGCESNTGTGVLIGGASGAAIGGIAGGGQGALIGGAAGVIVGGLIGASLDNQEQKNLKAQSNQTYDRIDNGQQLSVTDVINMHQAGISPEKQIELLEKTNSKFNLNNYQIEQLRKAGVSERVIRYMINS